jgi:large subunit ribosomal protein L9
LLKDVRRLGHVGDVGSTCAPGYARNYLLPQLIADFPTAENLAAIEEEKQQAAAIRAQRNAEFEQLVERLGEASVTIEAAANPEGTLYGSVDRVRSPKPCRNRALRCFPSTCCYQFADPNA